MQYITREHASSSIDVIPTSSEKFLSFKIGNLRFLDSSQFLTSSLDTLVQSLKVWLQMERINLVIPLGIIQNPISSRKGKLPLWIRGRKRQISIDRADSHGCFLQFTFWRNNNFGRVRPCTESVSRFRHRKHAAIARPLPKPRRPSASWCFWEFSANVHLGQRTRPRTL